MISGLESRSPRLDRTRRLPQSLNVQSRFIMHHFGFLNSKCTLPAPASPEHAAWGMEQWLQVASGDGETAAGGNDLKDFADEVLAAVKA